MTRRKIHLFIIERRKKQFKQQVKNDEIDEIDFLFFQK